MKVALDGEFLAIESRLEGCHSIRYEFSRCMAKFVKHLENTDLYEMRVSVGNNEYRTILFAVDKSNIIESTKIVLLNGFLKKSTKEYRKQIELAQSILKELEQ